MVEQVSIDNLVTQLELLNENYETIIFWLNSINNVLANGVKFAIFVFVVSVLMRFLRHFI